MSFFVRAVCQALQQYPIVNAAIDGNDIVWQGDADIGIAISTPRGLVVPILRARRRCRLPKSKQPLPTSPAARARRSLPLKN